MDDLHPPDGQPFQIDEDDDLAAYRARRAFQAARSGLRLPDLEEARRVVAPDGRFLLLEALDASRPLWGAEGMRGAGFGPLRQTLAAASGHPAGDDWVSATVAAIEREVAWPDWRTRRLLLVMRGEGLKFHVSASINRESIRRHGLDWRRMGRAPGIAGSLERLWLENDPGDTGGSGDWMLSPEPVPADRLALVEWDIPPQEDR